MADLNRTNPSVSPSAGSLSQLVHRSQQTRSVYFLHRPQRCSLPRPVLLPLSGLLPYVSALIRNHHRYFFLRHLYLGLPAHRQARRRGVRHGCRRRKKVGSAPCAWPSSKMATNGGISRNATTCSTLTASTGGFSRTPSAAPPSKPNRRDQMRRYHSCLPSSCA
ncbi:hypothetical protein B296_00020695 [Ensete ventricosum]|uniref:Uncharacterized protein n=1 Tax=Ensete ventricosum TaxID=4639 RepID=A0A426ZH82_ENSVE|nr:hypothetical protein B296_00020695 [Ensete ventricosum]